MPKNPDANVWRNKKRVPRNCYEQYMISLIKASEMLLKKVQFVFYPFSKPFEEGGQDRI